MRDVFSMETYKDRRRRFVEKMGSAVAVLPAAREQLRSHDVSFPFRQDSDFHYLTGFPEPDALALMVGGDIPWFVLFTRPRDSKQEIWTGHRYGPEGATEFFGADESYSIAEMDKQVPEFLSNVEQVYFPFGKDETWDRRMMGWINRVRLKGKRGSVRYPVQLLDPGTIVHEQRLIKDPTEVEVMRKCARITAEAHMLAMHLCRSGMAERELQSHIEHFCISSGAHAMAYPTIVAGGANACVLHYEHNSDTLKMGDLVLIDAGCELGYYASDMTRTFPVSGNFSPPQRDVYEAVLQAQLAGIEEARPGNTIHQVHETVAHILAEELVKMKLLKGNPERHARICLQAALTPNESEWDERLRRGEIGLRHFFMHNTSHWLGLDVHDVGAYRLKDQWRELEPGMVITVEPGIYISPDATYVPRQYQGIGVRIEDDVLVTSEEAVLLNHNGVKSIKEIEATCQLGMGSMEEAQTKATAK